MIAGIAMLALVATGSAQETAAGDTAPQAPPEAPQQGPSVQPPPAARVALVDALVHDFRTDAEPRRATVLIEGERIVAVEPDLELTPGTERVDASGLHLTPGLMDGLASFDPDHDALYVAHGVTTVRDPGGDVALIEVLRQPDVRDSVPGPTLLSAGAVFDGDPPSSAVAAVVQDPVTVAPLVQTLVERLGVEFLSAQPGLSEPALAALCEAGAARGLAVWSQGSARIPFERAVELGQRGFYGLNPLLPSGVEWSYVLPTAFRGRIALAAENQVAFMPMLGAHQRVMEPAEPDPRLELLSPDYAALWGADLAQRERVQADPEFGPTALRVGQKMNRLSRDLWAAGVPLAPGSSAPLANAFPGASLIDELEAWVQAGFSRTEALRAATSGAAAIYGLEDRGAIEAGRVADLVLLDSDPRETLAGYRSPRAVVVRGRVLDRTTLDDLIETTRRIQERVREELAKPIEIPPPSIPEEAGLLMSGQVETRALGSRLSSEAWVAFRMPDGSLHFRGRLLSPDMGRVAGVAMEIEQIVVDGELVAFALEARFGEDILQVEGVYDSSRFRMRRTLNGTPVDTKFVTQRPAAINFTPIADSVTTAFVLSQRERNGPTPVIAFGDFFEPIEQLWAMETGIGTERRIRTHQGVMVLRFDAAGGLVEWGRMAGRSVSTTVPIGFETWGGAGLPVAFEPGAAPEDGSANDAELGDAAPEPATPDQAPAEEAPVGPPAGDGGR